MVWLANTFEGLSSGTTVTAASSGGASGNAFDSVNGVSGGGTVQALAAAAMHGTVGLRLATASGGSLACVNWQASLGTITSMLYGRTYLRLAGYPPVLSRLISWNDGASNCGTLHVSPTGTLVFRDHNGSVVLTSAAVLPLGVPLRVEGGLLGAASTGICAFRYFAAPDAICPAEQQVSAATQALAGLPNEIQFGVAVTTSGIGPWDLDDVAATDQGWPGPSHAGALISAFP